MLAIALGLGVLVGGVPSLDLLAATATISEAAGTSTAVVSATATVTSPPPPAPAELGDAPLSPEDLALIAALEGGTETATTPAAAATPATIVWDPREQLLSTELAEVVPRSVAEAVHAAPSVFETRRSYLPGDRFSARGRGTARVLVLLDGVRLDDPLTSIAGDAVTATLDPGMLARTRLTSGAVLSESAAASAGVVALERTFPEVGPHLATHATVASRTADRSSEARVAAEGGAGPVGLRAEASYADFGAYQLGSSADDYLGAHQRTNLALRGQVFGREREPLRIRLGFDYDRLLNVIRFDLSPTVRYVDRFRSRRLFFGELTLGGATRGLRVLFAQQEHRLERSRINSREIIGESDANTAELRGDGTWMITPELSLLGGAAMSLSSAKAESTVLIFPFFDALSDHAERFGGYVGARWSPGPIELSATARLEHARAESAGEALSLSDTSILGEVRATVTLVEPLRIYAGWARTSRLPTLGDLALPLLRGPTPPAERSDTFELGPVLQLSSFELGATAFATRSIAALEPTLAGIDTVDLWLYGVESRVGWRPLAGLVVLGAVTWADGRVDGSGERPSELSGFRWHTDARYDIGVHGGFIELGLRGSFPGPDPSAFDRAQFDAPSRLRWLLVSARGGADLGLGFRAILALENAFDTPSRSFASSVENVGIDLRLMLEHRFETEL